MPINIRALRGERWPAVLGEALGKPPAEPGAWMAQYTRELKSDRYSRVGIITLDEQVCYLKFYAAKTPWQGLLFRLGQSRALVAYDAALELAACGVPVPEPRAVLGVPGGMLLLTEGLPAATDLKALWLATESHAERAGLLSLAGQVVGQLHRAGYAHGDCKWSNLLGDTSGFCLVDLEAVRACPPGDRRQLRDIARFTLNAEDLGAADDLYDCFLASYLLLVGGDREVLLAAVLPLLRPLRARHREKYGERGRPLL